VRFSIDQSGGESSVVAGKGVIILRRLFLVFLLGLSLNLNSCCTMEDDYYTFTEMMDEGMETAGQVAAITVITMILLAGMMF
jgi:hypothetical protein